MNISTDIIDYKIKIRKLLVFSIVAIILISIIEFYFFNNIYSNFSNSQKISSNSFENEDSLEVFIKYPNENYLLNEQKFETELYIVKRVNKKISKIVLDSGEEIPITKNKGSYSCFASGNGLTKKEGYIYTNDGKILPFSFSYITYKPTAKVITANNFLWNGIENNVTIEYFGISKDSIKTKVDEGYLEYNYGEYSVFPSCDGFASFSFFAQINGMSKLVSRQTIYSKYLPRPVPKIGFYEGGEITNPNLLVQTKVKAVLEGFDLETNYITKSFTVSATVGGIVEEVAVEGETISNEQKNLIMKVKEGGKVYFENIIVQTPNYIRLNLGTICFIIK